jgi:hypothetical protein
MLRQDEGKETRVDGVAKCVLDVFDDLMHLALVLSMFGRDGVLTLVI